MNIRQTDYSSKFERTLSPYMALLIRGMDLPMSIRSNPACATDFSLAAVLSSTTTTTTTATNRPFPFSVESTTPDLLEYASPDFSDDDHRLLDSRWVPTRTTRVEHYRNKRVMHDLEHCFLCKSGQYSICMSGGLPRNDLPEDALYYSTERNLCDMSPPRKRTKRNKIENQTTEPLDLPGMSPPRISHERFSSRSNCHLHEEAYEESQEFVGSDLGVLDEDDHAPTFDTAVFQAPLSNSTPAEEVLRSDVMQIMNTDPRDLSNHTLTLDTLHYEESQEDEDDKKPAAKKGVTFVPLKSINQVLDRTLDYTNVNIKQEDSEQSSSKSSESAGASSSSSAFSNEEADSSWSSAASYPDYDAAQEIHQDAVKGGGVEQEPVKLVKGEESTKKKTRKRKSRDIPRAERSRTIWFQRLEQLKEYKEAEGDCMVPQKYIPNPQLGVWVNKQRMEYTNRFQDKPSSMSEERRLALEAVGFTWAKAKGKPTWEKHYGDLVQYHAIHNHSNVPTKYPENPALGRWVSTQRSEHLKFHNNQKSHMTPEKMDRLEALGFCWSLQFPASK